MKRSFSDRLRLGYVIRTSGIQRIWNGVELWNCGTRAVASEADHGPEGRYPTDRLVGSGDCIFNVNDLQDRRDRTGHWQPNLDPFARG